MSSWPAPPLERLARWDGALALRLNGVRCRPWTRALLVGASRLGDGVFWYALMLALLLRFEEEAVPAVLHMIAAGLMCTLLYKWVKRQTVRARPYEKYPAIVLLAAPLDRYSFPSGHVLHAAAFAVVAVAYFPALSWLLVPFTILVAASRVVLGLHYPSDVLAGALLGATIATVSFLM